MARTLCRLRRGLFALRGAAAGRETHPAVVRWYTGSLDGVSGVLPAGALRGIRLRPRADPLRPPAITGPGPCGTPWPGGPRPAGASRRILAQHHPRFTAPADPRDAHGLRGHSLLRSRLHRTADPDLVRAAPRQQVPLSPLRSLQSGLLRRTARLPAVGRAAVLNLRNRRSLVAGLRRHGGRHLDRGLARPRCLATRTETCRGSFAAPGPSRLRALGRPRGCGGRTADGGEQQAHPRRRRRALSMDPSPGHLPADLRAGFRFGAFHPKASLRGGGREFCPADRLWHQTLPRHRSPDRPLLQPPLLRGGLPARRTGARTTRPRVAHHLLPDDRRGRRPGRTADGNRGACAAERLLRTAALPGTRVGNPASRLATRPQEPARPRLQTTDTRHRSRAPSAPARDRDPGSAASPGHHPPRTHLLRSGHGARD